MGTGRLEAFSDGVLAISVLATAVGRDLKGQISPGIYAIAIPSAFLRALELPPAG